MCPVLADMDFPRTKNCHAIWLHNFAPNGFMQESALTRMSQQSSAVITDTKKKGGLSQGKLRVG
jgi:hypothetical protein